MQDNYYKPLYKHIKEMTNTADACMEYTFPKSLEVDDHYVDFLKERKIYVDGYYLSLFLNKEEHKDYYYYQFQINGEFCNYLPISLICKLGKEFLSEEHLCLVETSIMDFRSYVWSLYIDKTTNKPIPRGQNKCVNFENFSFEYKFVLY